MANELSERLRGYLAQRSESERKTLAVGGLVLLILLGYGGIYEPLNQARTKLTAQLPGKRAEVRLMRVQAAEIVRLRASLGDAGKGTLEQRVKASAAAFGLTASFSQFTALASDQIQLTTQAVANSTWSQWLGDLERHGISVMRCRISAGEQPGQAKLELTLKGGQR